MVRFAALCLLFGSATLMAQNIQIFDRTLTPQTICGPIGLQARMLETPPDSPVVRQRVGIVLTNLNSAPIVLERITFHFANETPTSGAPFQLENKGELGGRQRASFAQLFSVPNPVSYVELNSVQYADGKDWSPSDNTACRVVPDPLP